MTACGAGPHAPLRIVAHYLDPEIELGRLSALDTDALARLVTGAALHEAFLATYARESILDPEGLAQRLVAVLAVDNSPEASSGRQRPRSLEIVCDLTIRVARGNREVGSHPRRRDRLAPLQCSGLALAYSPDTCTRLFL